MTMAIVFVCLLLFHSFIISLAFVDKSKLKDKDAATNSHNKNEPIIMTTKRTLQQEYDSVFSDTCFQIGRQECRDRSSEMECPADFAPVVCGSCANYVYSNLCEAAVVGWDTAHDCTEECPMPTMSNMKNDSSCDMEERGDPMYCGKNGWCQYRNPCMAMLAGFNVDTECGTTYNCPEIEGDCPCLEGSSLTTPADDLIMTSTGHMVGIPCLLIMLWMFV